MRNDLEDRLVSDLADQWCLRGLNDASFDLTYWRCESNPKTLETQHFNVVNFLPFRIKRGLREKEREREEEEEKEEEKSFPRGHFKFID